MEYLKVTYRQIAKMLTSALPVEDHEFRGKVEEHIEAIRKLPKDQRKALLIAYVFSRKVPWQEREDMFQELTLALLEAKAPDERLAYSIARCDWQDWWRRFKTRQHYLAGSLNTVVIGEEGEKVELGELLVGEVEFERKVDGKLDAQRIWAKLPEAIRKVVNKRLMGKALTPAERQRLSRYVRSAPTILVS